MKFEVKNHLLYLDGKQIPLVNTPNKKGTMIPTYEIIHYTADNSPEATISWFKNPKAKASAHLLIDRSGNVTQFGAFNEILWHAGASSWKGLIGMNSRSIGIELTNLGGSSENKKGFVFLKHKNEQNSRYWQSYTEEQLSVLKAVSECLVKQYKIIDILGHDDIAPGRKSDPGPAFPWSLLKDSRPVMRTTASVNFRTGPGMNFLVIQVIPRGTSVFVDLSEGNNNSEFQKVEFNGKIGYVSKKYLSL